MLKQTGTSKGTGLFLIRLPCKLQLASIDSAKSIPLGLIGIFTHQCHADSGIIGVDVIVLVRLVDGFVGMIDRIVDLFGSSTGDRIIHTLVDARDSLVGRFGDRRYVAVAIVSIISFSFRSDLWFS